MELTNTFIIVSITSVLLWILHRQSHKKLEIKNGELVLRLPKIVSYIGKLCLVTTVILFLLDTPNMSDNDFFPTILVVSIMSFISIFLIILTEIQEISVNSQRILHKNVLGNTKTLKWSEIKNVKTNHFSGYIIFYGETKKIKISLLNKGISELNEIIKKQNI